MSVEAHVEGAGLKTLAGSAVAQATVVSEEPYHTELKRRAVRGMLASSGGQAATFVLRMASMVILARLLAPEDFGLVGMVTAVTGFMELFKEAGLSDAAVQSISVNQDQLSTLFWINVALGSGLTLLCAVGAPAVAAFYGEPRVFWIMLVAGTSFVFTGLATQHRAALRRGLRIQTLVLIDIVSLIVSIVVSIAMAATGFGYWALVASVAIVPACTAAGTWLASGWVPSRPRRGSGARAMIIFGGTVTLNSLVIYIAYNADKVLLGRFWGAAALGIYGRAYTLMNLPTNGLHTALGSVAFPTLSRVQDDPERFRSYFLRMYSLFLSLALPVTAACALFSNDIVYVLLGPKWSEVAVVFRLLAPTIIAFALMDPFGWVTFASGRVKQSLQVALVITPTTIVAYWLGLSHGPQGVAAGFSIAMVVLVAPVIFWTKQQTSITARDVLRTVMQPAVSMLAGVTVALLLWSRLSLVEPPLLRLIANCSVLFGVYFGTLLFAFGQGRVYVRLLQETGLWPARWCQTAPRGN